MSLFLVLCEGAKARMSVRALCEAACELGLDAGTAKTLALYEGVLAADADAQKVLAWALALANELRANRRREREHLGRTAADSDGERGVGEAARRQGREDEALWGVDEEQSAARALAAAQARVRRREAAEELLACQKQAESTKRESKKRTLAGERPQHTTQA